MRYTVHECRARLGFETRPRIVIGSQQIETLLKLGSLDDAEAHRRTSILADDIEQIGFDTFQLSCRPYPVLSANGESSQLEHRMGETRRNARTRRQARGREMNAHEPPLVASIALLAPPHIIQTSNFLVSLRALAAPEAFAFYGPEKRPVHGLVATRAQGRVQLTALA